MAGHYGDIPAIEFFATDATPKPASGSRFLADDYDIALYRWRYEQGRLQRVERLKALSELDYKDMRISPNNRYLWVMRLVGYIVDLRAGTTRRVTGLYEYFEGVFSPDSRYLVGTQLKGEQKLVLFEVPSGQRIPVASGGDYNCGWYPDSRAIWFYDSANAGKARHQVYRFDLRSRRVQRLSEPEVRSINTDWEMLRPQFRRWLPANEEYVYAPNNAVRAKAVILRDRRGSAVQTDFSVEWRTGKRQPIAHTWNELSLKAVSNDGRYVLAYCRRIGDGAGLEVFDVLRDTETTIQLPEMEVIKMLGAIKIWFV
jgi:hypothetical protein